MTTLPSSADPVRAPHGIARVAPRMATVVIGFTMLLAVTGHGFAQELPPNKNVLDSKLAVQVATALWSDLRFPGRQISVDAQDGVVTLRGKVDSEDAKKAADDILGRLEGVRKVRNELRVVPPDRRAEVDAADQDIARALDIKFKQEPQLQNAVIDTRVDAGVVTLSGQVRSNAASARAVALARAVPGVRRVRNELTSLPLDKSG